MTPEQRVQTKIIDFIKSRAAAGDPVVYERRQAGGFNYKKGAPDLWFAYNGLHVEVEVKAPGGEPSPLQITKEEIFTKAGCLYWRGSSCSEFIHFYKTIIAVNQ